MRNNLSIFYQLLCFQLLVLCFQITISSSSSVTQLCSYEESVALIQFKTHFSINQTASKGCDSDTISHPKTNSWKEGTDCCLWDGVSCDNITGRVISLDLSCSLLSGTIPPNSTLFHLSHMQRLNLSFNDFKNSKISPEFGHFSSLTHLDLSNSWFSGSVPYEISYLSKLLLLDLSSYSVDDIVSLQPPKPILKLAKSTLAGIVQNLTKVREIYFDGIDMSSVDPKSFKNVSYSLTSLTLIGCDLRGYFPDSIFNLPNIKTLYLMDNYGLIGQFPKSNWSSPLENLLVSSTSFSGGLPESIGNLKSLQGLGIVFCDLSGSIPRSLGNLSQLRYLFLASNHLSGKIPSSLTNLTQLIDLYIAYNQLEGSIPDCPNAFPNLSTLYLCYNLLSGTTPSRLYNHPILTDLDLSNNQFIGHIHEFQHSFLKFIHFGNNKFQGSIPSSIQKLVNLRSLDLSSNSLKDAISLDMFSKLQNLSYLDLSSNSLSVSSNNELTKICNMKLLEILDLSRNNFHGIIPQCIGNFSQSLSSLNLKMNKFHGIIPPAFAKGCGLKNLNLDSNHLEGPLPRSISNCKDLEVLDVGNNKIHGAFPHWIEGLSKLQVLVLHSNKFHGSIGDSKNTQPPPKLRIIDLSRNNFFGPLPASYIKNFKGMMNLDESKAARYMGERDYSYDYSVEVVVKGLEMELVKILTIFTSIDLSSNSFEGEIPTTFGELSSLRGLNLSHNNLTGHISPSLGNLTQLEWLDISSNKLGGQIPNELIDLTFLSFVNVSDNQLVGPIPRGKQFNTFENGSYEGNEGLCGLPLSRSCSSNVQQALPWMNSTRTTTQNLNLGGRLLPLVMDLDSYSEWLWVLSLFGWAS
ncbi:hypothetical protein PTKIN_Ptkin14bG0226800 [Pterospermum kingtungense]